MRIPAVGFPTTFSQARFNENTGVSFATLGPDVRVGIVVSATCKAAGKKPRTPANLASR